MVKWIWLLLGGITGTAARYFLAGAVYQRLGTNFPYGTLVVNLIGCFLIGFFSAIVDDKFILGPYSRVFLMIGFCGAFTTFSTYMLETGNLLKDGETIRALMNILVSTAVGFLAYRLGVIIGNFI